MMLLSQAAQVLGGKLTGQDVLFTSVSSDSRKIAAGDLFVALQGERFDGAAFVAGAVQSGAVAAMVNADKIKELSSILSPQSSILAVEDTRLALGRLAAHWREQFAIPLVAVTGSNGKTTVKEMLAGILRQHTKNDFHDCPLPPGGRVGEREQAAGSADAVLATQGNLNNDIGMPLTLLKLRAAHRYAVIEMGMNHPGEIDYLTRLARPDVAIVNNAGGAHLAGLGSVEAVARAKGEIFAGLPENGIAVINADDAHAPLWRKLAGGRAVIEFGLERHVAVHAQWQPLGHGAHIEVRTPQGGFNANLQVPGVHNVRNALAATAAALALHVGLPVIAAGLEKFSGVAGRLQRKAALHGAVLIDDSYNANPASLHAALKVLVQAGGKKILVLGDMGELGADAVRLHGEIGVEARRFGVDELLALGELTTHTVQEFGAGARHFERIEDLFAALDKDMDADSTVLVKGSRFMKMERVVKHLESGANETHVGRKSEAPSDALKSEAPSDVGVSYIQAVDNSHTADNATLIRPTGGETMLLALSQWLAQDIRTFNVFGYITLRAVLAAMTALFISFMVGPMMIRKLTAYKIGQAVRDDGPQSHLVKVGTPTMGGALILTSVAITTLLWSDLKNPYVWVALLTTLGFGAIGWVDDYRKVVHRNPKGLSARTKMFWQSIIALIVAVYLWRHSSLPAHTELIVPFLKYLVFPLGATMFIVLTYLVIVGSSNAVNLTDGLDGLAIMPTVMVSSALALFAYIAGHAVFAKYLGVPHVPGASELAVFCSAIAGAGLAFLWFNAYPAEVFMGDVGALALGAALGTVAVIVRQELVLFIMGGVFVVEAVSVMLQVSYFKYTKKIYGEGRRILLMAPLHHHFEQKGWKETQVVVRFWIITMMLVLLGLATLKLR